MEDITINNIVSVKFQSKYDPEEFTGREYNYLTSVELHVDDIVIVPTKNGDGIAQVTRVNVPKNQIDERIMPLLKTIEHLYQAEALGEPGFAKDDLEIIEDNQEAVCRYCEITYNSGEPLSTNPNNLCDGKWCEEANNSFLEKYREEKSNV